jgi:hypothetical protein
VRKVRKWLKEEHPFCNSAEFCMWFLQDKAYAFRFGYVEAMEVTAEVELPATQGPGVTAAQQAAVERNMKAVAFLISAMPDSIVINVMAAGPSNTDWTKTQSTSHGCLPEGVLRSDHDIVESWNKERLGELHDEEGRQPKGLV